MTDNEIIKALECCRDAIHNSSACEECPCFKEKFCAVKSANDILDLINRKQAEIERLRTSINTDIVVTRCYGKLANVKKFIHIRANAVRAEAIKEFVERFKARMDDCAKVENGNGDYYFLIGKSFVDETAEEMAGEKK